MTSWCVLLLIQLLLHTSFGLLKFCEKSCPINEVFSRNVSQCHNTCFNQDFNSTAGCSTSPGCVCTKGFIRNQDSYKCVPLKSCADKRGSKQCADNEFYTDCDAGCQKTCQTRNLAIKCRCVSGCACRKGYIRSDVNYQCIPEKLCQSCPIGYAFSATTKTCFMNCVKCNVNESYSSCGSSCEATCSNPTNQGVFCTQNCKEGCFCDKGYVRDVTSGLCVLINNCKKCPDNESWKCGNDLCETTCQTIGQKCTKFPYKCRDKCYCDVGYVRALDGAQCVRTSQCPVING